MEGGGKQTVIHTDGENRDRGQSTRQFVREGGLGGEGELMTGSEDGG